MDREICQLTRIVDDLLDGSRVTRGKIRLIREVVDLRRAADAGIEATLPFIEQSQQTLRKDVGRTPIYVDGDLSRLTQCVTHWLNNAAKDTPEGGHFTILARSAAGMAELSVRDTGIRFQPTDHSRIDLMAALLISYKADGITGKTGTRQL